MARRDSPFTFVDLHGRPLGGADQLAKTVKQVAEQQRDDEAAQALAPADLEPVFDALVIAGWRRGKTALMSLLRALDWRHGRGGSFTGTQVGGALRRLAAAGRVQSVEGEGWFVPEALAEPRLAQLLRQPAVAGWWRPWLWSACGAVGAPDRMPPYFNPRSADESLALLRLLLARGVGLAEFSKLTEGPLRPVVTTDALRRVLAQLHRLQLLDRVHPPLLWQLLASLDLYGLLGREPPLLRWVQAHLDAAPAEGSTGLRLSVAELHMHRGEGEAMRQALAGDALAQPFVPLFQALLAAVAGRFADTAAAFPPAWKALTSHLGKRRGFAPPSLLQLYPLALMAQPDAAAWTTARKFCVSLSGSRSPSPFDDWGRWAHVLAVRLGDERLEPQALQAGGLGLDPRADPDRLADRLVLTAWLGKSAGAWKPAWLETLVEALVEQGLPWKADLVLQACHRLGLAVPARPPQAPPPWPVAYFAPQQDAWRDALAAIAALGEGKAASREAPLATLQWRITLDAEGRLHDLQALEPGATARARPKPLTPLQLKKRTRLDPRDAAVARCLRQGRFRATDFSFDVVQAAQALLGHPALSFADAPDVAVELTESLPVLEVRRERAADAPQGAGAEAEHFVFRLHDALLFETQPEIEFHLPNYDQMDAEAERRNSLLIVRDSPERARLIRITPAQRRVAELVAQRWTVPVDATAELDAALRVLSAHFVLHSDAAAGEAVASDARLVAQLQPRGDGLRLTLAVRPFGTFGPLLAPGQGRPRLMTLHAGVSLATERELDAERRHLAAVLEALPFLDAAVDDAPLDGTWLLEDPEQALAAVQHLGQLAAVGQAVRALEWPHGRTLRVFTPEAQAFSTTLASGRDWFALDGELQLDEGRVLSLQQLLVLLRESRGSRYVALGEGQYLRLADQLRQRLAELEALAEAEAKGDRQRLKLGATASAWLADAAPTLGLKGDAAWRQRAADLERAAALQPEPPPGLQAMLRPYQAEGFAWMLRLAESGFGAILADDMGLGKTVQTLALLLARAAAGPALVVAPTSVCDNWATEAARFAPGLRCSIHGRGDGDRAAQVARAAAGDLLVVSYALLLRDAEAFAAQTWATLVLDEAQALKNAATQRVQAVGALQAGFRLALSGTPVENRLADLWSLMNLINPGLLGTAARFAERFGNPIERQRNDAARARLRRLVSPFLLRRTKAQVLSDLPPRTEIVQRIEPSPEERAFLEAMRRDALARIAQLDPADPGKNRFNVLAELTRLRRAACDPRLAAPELGRIGAKVQAFERLATELVEARHQALVFSQFTDFLKLLAERLDACGLRYRYLDGATPAAARGELVASFQRGEADLFLISLKAGGFGLNLTAADYVVIADPWWNPAVEDQAMGRAHRIGQQRPVTVYRLVTAGSIEERIVALHQDKRELAEGLLAGQDGAAPLAAAELIDLLRDAD
jgi:superfamily II DNA or RNA helicase